MFWGLILKANKKYSQTLKSSFHLSQASLDETASTDEAVQVMYIQDDNAYLLCTLQKNKTKQCALDLNFSEGSKVCFSTKGNGIVHLTGYLIPDEFGLDDEDLDEEEEDEEMEESEQIDDLRKKLKEKKNKVEEKAKKEKDGKKSKVTVPAQEDDSDEDDDDYEEGDEEEEDDDSDENDVSMQEGNGQQAEEDDDDEDEDDDDDDEEEDDSDDEEEEEDSDEEVEEPKPKQIKLDKGNDKKKQQQNNQKQPQENGLQNGKAKEKDGKKDKKEVKDKENKEKQQTQGTGKMQKLQGGLQFSDLKVGNGTEAKPGKKIAVFYEGRLQSNNKMFDSTKQGPGFKFVLGRNEVIRGWDLGLVGMKVGGKRKLIIPAALAYGAKGSPPVIPPNSTLVFDVELKNVF
jgi:FK506-binding nuclear protein